MLKPWIKNPGGLDADNFIQSGSVVRGAYVYHRSYSVASKSCWGSFCDPYVYVVFKPVRGLQGLRTVPHGVPPVVAVDEAAGAKGLGEAYGG